MEIKKSKNMNEVKETCDKWAQNGRAELMEIEHGDNVSKFLQKISLNNPFTFLDVGCGNGWVVRKIAKENNCKKAIGIDISKKMIIQAKKKQDNNKEELFHTDVESWNYK
jgi:ubiquinone/menaquinone biosynthesis C-methylase UbiE